MDNPLSADQVAAIAGAIGAWWDIVMRAVQEAADNGLLDESTDESMDSEDGEQLTTLRLTGQTSDNQGSTCTYRDLQEAESLYIRRHCLTSSRSDDPWSPISVGMVDRRFRLERIQAQLKDIYTILRGSHH
ncbi:hypothetical protein AB5N19_06982 [Seiridium cardinale]|uniref:Uncharacterized protein n=1 Tax=Seiridium cardinale TaxID=138064 RepID=A0ABR2XE20_9PEZI